MISASAAYLAANAKPNKVPIYLFEIEGYHYGFSNADNLGGFVVPDFGPIGTTADSPTTVGAFVPDPGGLGYGACPSISPSSCEIDRWESRPLGGLNEPGIAFF